jgi:GcrA cell cycle regulator
MHKFRTSTRHEAPSRPSRPTGQSRRRVARRREGPRPVPARLAPATAPHLPLARPDGPPPAFRFGPTSTPDWVVKAKPYVERPGRDARIPITQRRSLLELDSETCRWPVHDPAGPDFFFCGARSAAGRPYCAAHCRRAYRVGDRTSAARNRREARITGEAK